MSQDNRKESFLDSLKGMSPRCQMIRCFNLFETKDFELGNSTCGYFYDLSINNNLLGCFDKLVSYMAINCPSNSSRQPKEWADQRRNVEADYFRETNNLKREIQEVRAKSGEQALAQLYLQIAHVAIKYGMYEESEQYLRKVRDSKVLDNEQFYPLLLKTNLLSRKFQRAAAMVLPNLDKNKLQSPELIEFCVGEGLREVYQGSPSFFKSLIGLNPSPQTLVNEYATVEAIGQIYSVLIVSNGNRKLVDPSRKFSSGFQTLYLNYQYKQFLQKVTIVLSKYRFDPFIGHQTKPILKRIKAVLLFEVLNAYKVIRVQTVMQILGYSENAIKEIIADNRRHPTDYSQYQIDILGNTITLKDEGNLISRSLGLINENLEARRFKMITQQFAKSTREQQQYLRHSFRDYGVMGKRSGRSRQMDYDYNDIRGTQEGSFMHGCNQFDSRY